MLVHLDLFSGIGGFALACQWAGIETIGFVEIDKYCQKVLKKHWPEVPIVEDIRNVARIKEVVINATGEGCLAKQSQARVSCQAISETPTGQPSRADSVAGIGARATATCEPPTPAILATAGFPCQPFSVAGKQLSQGDDRYLWPQTLAVIKAVKPQWVLLENVTGIINLAVDTVLSDLEGADYTWETLVIPACSVNAWHRRDRIWIVAFSEQPTSWQGRLSGNTGNSGRRATEAQRESIQPPDGAACPDNLEPSCPVMALATGRESRQQAQPEGWEDISRGSQEVAIADPSGNGSEARVSRQDKGQEGNPREFINGGIERGGTFGNADCPSKKSIAQTSRPWNPTSESGWWAVEPQLGRVAHGVPHRVDRLKCLGNAIVPQVAYEIIKAIVEIDERIPHLDYTVDRE